jgi:hypothetical protein
VAPPVTEEIEGVLVICSDGSLEQLLLLAGNELTRCCRCRKLVVISTEGRALIAANPLVAQPICMACAVAESPEVVPEVVPGAIERAERLGLTLSPRTREAMRHKPLKEYESEGLS